MVIEAYLALLRESRQAPTAVQVAERAGYSVRSVFERFPDLQALRLAATDYALAQANVQSLMTGFEGDREARLRAHVERRAQACAEWLPLWRAVGADKNKSEDIETRIRVVRMATIKRIELMYRAELATLTDLERSQAVLAIEALIDFESWARMREYFGLSFDEACAVWIDAIDRLLPATPADS